MRTWQAALRSQSQEGANSSLLGETSEYGGHPRSWAPLFALVFKGCDGLVELRAFPAGRPVARLFCEPTDDDAIARFLGEHRESAVDFGVATRRDRSSGALRNCLHLAALFMDVDFKATPEAEARRRLARCPLRPSAIVLSGGGLHVYWRLREPLELASEPEAARRQLRQLAVALGGDIVAAEPAHVLRVPGSYNVKPEYGTPKLVRVESLA